MLKQILRDMYVDPEILAGLDETYKQTLFCKMREEQIRRWKLWDEEQQHNEKKNKNLIESKSSNNENKNNSNDYSKNIKNVINNQNNIKKHVSFRLGDDGEPWVWVMGEHENDLTIEEILEEEAKQKARQLAENEFFKNVEINNINISDIINHDEFIRTKSTPVIVETNKFTSLSPLLPSLPLTVSPTSIPSSLPPLLSLNRQQITQKTKNTNNDVNNIITNETPKIEDFDIYCSVDELKEKLSINNQQQQQLQQQQKQKHEQNNNNNIVKFSLISNNNCDSNKKFDVLQEICYNKQSQKVSARIALWEQRTIGQRTSEIFNQIQKKKQEVVKEAEEAAKKEEELWKEQERKAKQAEIQMREIARRAREEHRKSLCNSYEENENYNNNHQKHVDEHHQQHNNYLINLSSSLSSPTTTSPSAPSSHYLDTKSTTPLQSSLLSSLSTSSRPQNQNDVINWYRKIEFPKCVGINAITNRPEKWFHGLLSRLDAENLLIKQPKGTYLIRISEKIYGYAISYKDTDRCKHYLIDASNFSYKFIGQNQLEHNTLNDLLRHHISVPITVIGNELLLQACPSTVKIPPIIQDLL